MRLTDAAPLFEAQSEEMREAVGKVIFLATARKQHVP
jgi:hypothetical protein